MFGRYAFSQKKVDLLWQPAKFDIGIQYAYSLKTTALGLVYGPIYPLAYLITAVGLALTYLCTRVGMRYWYQRPGAVNQNMMMEMRRRLGNVLGLSVAVSCLATARSIGSHFEAGLSSGGVYLVGGAHGHGACARGQPPARRPNPRCPSPAPLLLSGPCRA